MAESLQYKHAFDFFYKWVPTGSASDTGNNIVTNSTWSQHYNPPTTANTYMSASWYDLGILTSSVSTRHTASITTKDAALAWASPAADLLWNVLTPSMSFSQSIDGAGRYRTFYRFTYNSESLFRNNFFPAGVTAGATTYPITSSWIAYEPKMIRYASGSDTNVGYVIRGTGFAFFPGYVEQPLTHTYALPTAATLPTTTYPNVGQNPSSITYGLRSTGSNDGRFFDLAGGCGITRAAIAVSLQAGVDFEGDETPIGRTFLTQALKSRRLFFPTVRPTGSGSPGTSDADYWLHFATQRRANQYFTENGGIYNVKFTIKRDPDFDFEPDAGQNSQLLIFIHNVNAPVPALAADRVPGADGWYPPTESIVRIKNDPQLSFANPVTGYLTEQYNTTVIQYGVPAQLVFEASGSLEDNTYFGCIIDDVEFCKIGVTTDPRYIKPETPADVVTDGVINVGGGVTS